MSSKQRSTPKRDGRRKASRTKPSPRARSLEQIARPARVDEDDDDVPAIELPGRRGRGESPPARSVPVPAEASADMRQVLLALEWAAARGMSLSSVTHGPVTIGVALMGPPRAIAAGADGAAASRLYEQYGGAALQRALAEDSGPEDSED